MADSGTLATTAQVLLAIGSGASADQVLEANTNYWILYAESEMSKIANRDFVTGYASIEAYYKQWLATVAASRAAWWAIQQDQNAWTLATSQSKLNVIDSIWQDFIKDVQPKDQDIIDDMGL